jgi:DNA (cytosine-5)-methyltransferase 1
MEFNTFDMFSGAGFMSQGFRENGFHIVAGMDNFKEAIDSFMFNFPDSRAYHGDVEDKAFLNEMTDELAGKVDVIIGGVPCGSYSTAGNRDPLEHRAYYFLRFFEVVKRLKPKAFVFENVPGLTSMKIINPDLLDDKLDPTDTNLRSMLSKLRQIKDLTRFGKQRSLSEQEKNELEALNAERKEALSFVQKHLIYLLEYIIQLVKGMDYTTSFETLDSKFYGSAQSRKRLFIVGIEKGLKKTFDFPQPTARCQQCGTMVNVVKGKCSISPLHELEFNTPENVLKDLIGKPEEYLENHVYTKHDPEFVKRIHVVKQGESLYKNYKDSWFRLLPDAPSRSCKENHNAAFLHFSEDRVVTPREMMRLISAPDSFILKGMKSKIIKLIGNGVDVAVSRAIAKRLNELLSREN